MGRVMASTEIFTEGQVLAPFHIVIEVVINDFTPLVLRRAPGPARSRSLAVAFSDVPRHGYVPD